MHVRAKIATSVQICTDAARTCTAAHGYFWWPPILHLTKITTISPPTYRAPKRCFLHMPAIQQVMPSPMLLHPTHLRLPCILREKYYFQPTCVRRLNWPLSHGWAASTLRGYDSNVKQFRRWCDKENIPQMLQCPADEFVLCAFAASDVGRLGGGTARKKITAIKAWHAAHNAPWNGSKRLSYILSGVERLAPDSARLPPRPPISAHMLKILAESLDESSAFDAAVLACSLVAFWGQCRLGELLSTNSRNFSTACIPARHNLRVSRKNSAATVRILHLPRTKTQQVRGEDVILMHQLGGLDPILALTRHFQLNTAPTAALYFPIAPQNPVVHFAF